MLLYEPVLFGALAKDGATDPEIDAGAMADARTMIEHPWFLTDDPRVGTDPWLEVFIDYWNRPGAWSRMPEHLKGYARSAGWKMYQEVRTCFFGIDSFSAVSFGDVPTTLVMGEHSPRASRAMSRALARKNPAARLVEVAKTGHMGPLTHPHLVNEPMLEHARATRRA
jgi:pimeloyl-ACP methyl ester carboxylesterase